MRHLTIGKVAKSTGFGIETVRFYEREGLIGPADRTESNYRIYKNEDVDRLRFIKHAKDLGFTLKEISELLSLSHDPAARKEDVKKQTELKIAEIDTKIRDLRRIRDILASLDSRCDGHGPAIECPILAALAKDEETESQQGSGKASR